MIQWDIHGIYPLVNVYSLRHRTWPSRNIVDFLSYSYGGSVHSFLLNYQRVMLISWFIFIINH